MIMMVGPPPPPPPGRGGAANPANARWNWRRMQRLHEPLARPALEQHRRRVQHAGDRPHRGRLGTGQLRRPAAVQRRLEQQPAAQLQREPELQRVERAAVHDPHRRRHQRRPASSTIAPTASAATPCARTGQWTIERLLQLLAGRSASRSSMPGGINFRTDGGGLAASQGCRAERRAGTALSFNVQRPEPHQPRQSHGLHRNAHVDQFREADDGSGHAEGGYRLRAIVLM